MSEEDNPSGLREFRDVDWSIHYARIGEFIVEFEKITNNLRFTYNVLLQNDGLRTWKLGEFLLYIETIGPNHLALCLESAVKTIFPDAESLITEATAIRKAIIEVVKTRNEIAHGEWGFRARDSDHH